MEDVVGVAGEDPLGHKLPTFKQQEKGLCCLNLVIVLIYMDLQLYSVHFGFNLNSLCCAWVLFEFPLQAPRVVLHHVSSGLW